MVLAKDADLEASRYGDGSLRRVLDAAEDVQERGLAGSVRAHEAVALARVEEEGGVPEENLAAERLSESGNGDHARICPGCGLS